MGAGETPDSFPKQAVILAAGRGARLSPYTDDVPTALLHVGGKPMVQYSIEALRRCGVERFVICRGWSGSHFESKMNELGAGVTLQDCPDFEETGMIESLRRAMEQLGEGGFYVVYGDVVFRPSMARLLQETPGQVSVLAVLEMPGRQSKGLDDLEVVVTAGFGNGRKVRRIGKKRCVQECEILGEFGGFLKVTCNARKRFDDAFRILWRGGDGDGHFRVPWWLEPVQKADLCDLLQYLIDDGVAVGVATVSGGWHEVNTPHDFVRVQNDTETFLSDDGNRYQVKAMGSCLLSEANDLKRPLHIVAKELNVALERLECLLTGDMQVQDALVILRKMCEVYPIPLNDLWLDADDTDGGVRVFTREAALASSRTLDRQDANGSRSPYYEYRDAAMTRCSQFRPEWIRELRVVTSGDPLDPDVQLNNGHLMMQTTLFIGPVDFYWKDRHGVVHREEMNTGDSNYISPFVPHSFTARSDTVEAIIIAVTYGGRVRKAFAEFARVGSGPLSDLAGDRRNPDHSRRCVLQRFLGGECMTESIFAEELVKHETTPERAYQLINGAEPTPWELDRMACVFSVKPSDLMVCPLEDHEEVVVTHAPQTSAKARLTSTYQFTPLARTRHQPELKTFDLEILEGARPGDVLRCGFHCFAYNFGSMPVELNWENNSSSPTCGGCCSLLRTGDSAYIAPLVSHRFSVCANAEAKQDPTKNPNGKDCGPGRRIFLVRIPGNLTSETLAEFATFCTSGRDRVGAENARWYS